MFRSLMTIIRELYLYLTKIIFMLKHSAKLHRYILVERHVCCVLYRVRRSCKLYQRH